MKALTRATRVLPDDGKLGHGLTSSYALSSRPVTAQDSCCIGPHRMRDLRQFHGDRFHFEHLATGREF